VQVLEELGAPKGSYLQFDDSERRINFGKLEGLAIYLNGTDLPDEVYETGDINFICDEFTRLLGDDGELGGDWNGPTETALYIYGRSYQSIRDKIAPFIAEYPLCQKARIEQIA
jgi:broad specificity phosphatase PhoE